MELGQVFSEYFSFPCQFSFHRLLYIQLSSGADTIGPLMAGVLSGHSDPSPALEWYETNQPTNYPTT
jgi:hypothetical protein